MELAKFVAIVAAGFWTVYLYATNEKQREQLALKQLTLDITRTELENSKLELDGLLNSERRKIESQGSFGITLGLESGTERPGKQWRTAVLTYDYENRGAVPVDVNKVVIQWYIGEVTAETIAKKMFNVNVPPLTSPASLEVYTSGDVKWTRVAVHGCDSLRSRQLNVDKVALDSIGCGMGRYTPGQSTRNSDQVIVTAADIVLVGASIVVTYGPRGFEKHLFRRMFQILPGSAG